MKSCDQTHTSIVDEYEERAENVDVTIRDVEAEAVEAVLFLWKRKRKQKRENSTASAST